MDHATSGPPETFQIARSEPPGRRKREWTVGMVETSVRSRGRREETRMLAMFDVLDDLYNRADREARTFVEVLAKIARNDALEVGELETRHQLDALVARLAAEAQFAGADEFTIAWRILIDGATLRAVAGDLDAVSHVTPMARDLVARHRRLRLEAHPMDDDAGFENDLGVDFDAEFVFVKVVEGSSEHDDDFNLDAFDLDAFYRGDASF